MFDELVHAKVQKVWFEQEHQSLSQHQYPGTIMLTTSISGNIPC